MTSREIARMIGKALEPLIRTVRLSIGRAVLASIKDSTGIQTAQLSLLAGETKEMERFQNYGFTSVPIAGAEGLCVFVGGNREHGICLSLDDRAFRVKNLGQGEVAVYDSTGTKIHLKNNGEVQVVAATKVDIDSAAVEIGDGVLEKVFKAETFQAFFNAHVHVGNLGAPVAPPTTPSGPAELSTVVKTA